MSISVPYVQQLHTALAEPVICTIITVSDVRGLARRELQPFCGLIKSLWVMFPLSHESQERRNERADSIAVRMFSITLARPLAVTRSAEGK